MSTFPTVNPLWDFNLPADSLATLPDDDFLAILHSQIAEANNSNNSSAQPFQSYYVPQQNFPQEKSIDTNAKSATQLPTTNTPPSLSDSTPSPPSGFEPGLVDEPGSSRTESDPNGWPNMTGDELRKRKASFAAESDNEQGHSSQRTHLVEQGKHADLAIMSRILNSILL